MMWSDIERPYIMQSFTADSMVLILEGRSYYTDPNFRNTVVQNATEVPISLVITSELMTPNFPSPALLFQELSP